MNARTLVRGLVSSSTSPSALAGHDVSLHVALLCICLWTPALHAHHAPALYDMTRTVTVAGTVVEFVWEQPHTWLRIAAADEAGNETLWSLEGMHPDFLGRRGWSRHTIASGDVVEVTFLPRKDGSRSGMVLEVELPDGTRKVMATRPGAERQ